MKHEDYMREALKEAALAAEAGEVPVGAVVVSCDRIIARAHNLSQTLHDPTAHAEMQAITAAVDYLGGKYLDKATLYVSLEPCPMCAGALAWAQLGTLVYAAADPKKGYSLLQDNILHPQTQVVKGILETVSAKMLQDFFAGKRK